MRVRVSPTAPYLIHGPLVKRFNTAAFHAVIQGFESPTGHLITSQNEVLRYSNTEHFAGGGPTTGWDPTKVGEHGGLAQLGEHLPYKQRVGGSIPSASTIYKLAGRSVENAAFCGDADA